MYYINNKEVTFVAVLPNGVSYVKSFGRYDIWKDSNGKYYMVIA